MNPSSAGIWCNPPPPGTDEDESKSPAQKESPERVIDRIDPFVKSAEYIKYERKMEHRRRSRSKSRHRRRRSHSRGRHRHRRRRYSSSRSRSRSRSRRKHKRSRHSKSHSRSRSRSRSHKARRSRHHRSRSRRRSRSPHAKAEPEPEDKRPKEDEEVEEEEDEEDDANENQFKNDGSFMEMFKKMQEEQLQKSQTDSGTAAETKLPPPAFGKRRGGKILKTGLVQKNKNAGQEEGDAQDAWTLYMKEVKRYKEACCDDDSKTRLLVK